MSVPEFSIEIIPMDTYRLFLAKSDTKTLFHDPDWLAVTSKSFKLETELFGFFDDDGQLCAVCPVQMRKLVWPVRIAGSPLPQSFTPYLGVVFGNEVDDAMKANASRQLHRYLGKPYFLSKWRTGNCSCENGTDTRCGFTAVINTLKTEDDLFAGMSKSTRRKVKQARKRGACVSYVDELGDWIGDYMRLSSLTYRRQDLRTPMRREFIETLFDKSNALGLASGVDMSSQKGTPDGARTIADHVGWHAAATLVHDGYDGQIIAASLFVFDGSVVYCLDSVMDRTYQNLRPHNARIWEIIRWASREGFDEVDLVGANIPGIAEFKLGFGAKRQHVCCITDMSLFGRMLYVARRAFIKCRQRIK